jgi:uncharacterized protein
MEHLISPDLLYGISSFCVGVLVGMTGVGGGSLMTPLLILVFGVHPTTQHVITVTLGGVLLVTALFLITGRSLRTDADRLNRLDPHTARLFTVALGLTMGVLVTITSVGAGAIGVTVLLLLHPKMPAGRIVGSDIAHGVPLTLLAGAGHWYLDSVDWSLLGNLLIGSLPGIVFGSYLATRARDAVVRMTLAGILVIVGVRLLG